MAQDALEKAFLAELEALEKFRISYSGAYPNAPLAREDPDIRRLIEAMAMFTARTRVAAQRNVAESFLRMFRQHFPFLVSPVPATTLIRARPTRRYVDMSELPRGTEVHLTHRARHAANDVVFAFETLAPLRIFALDLESVDIFRRRGQGFRILFRFVAPFARNDEIGDLALHVNQLNDLFSSLTVFYALKSHVKGVSVVFAESVHEDTQGQPCEVAFGAPRASDLAPPLFEHPLQRVRSLFQFPQQELFITFRGIKPPRNWQHVTLCFDVDEDWPAELRLTPDAFDPHVVPIANVRKQTADPIEHDGTKERYAILHPDRAARFVFHSALGVYKMTPAGLLPLAPSVVGVDEEGYEIVVEGDGDERRAWLTLNLPNAFEKPERVVVEALWHQPHLGAALGEAFRVRLADRFVDGIEWSCVSEPSPSVDAELNDTTQLLQLLSIKNQRFLGRYELTFLLRALGATRMRQYARLVGALADVKVTAIPFARRSSGFKYVYTLSFDNLEGSDLAALDLFSRRVLDVLSVWSVEEVVELVASAPNLGKELRFT